MLLLGVLPGVLGFRILDREDFIRIFFEAGFGVVGSSTNLRLTGVVRKLCQILKYDKTCCMEG